MPTSTPAVTSRPCEIGAGQFPLLDQTFDWKETTCFMRALGEIGLQPERWDRPADFLNGTIHGRLEVLEKPTDLEVTMQFCLWQDGHETCKHRDVLPIRFSGPGVQRFSFPSPGTASDGVRNENWQRCKGDDFFSPARQVEVVQVQCWAHNRAGERKVVRERGKHWPKDAREDMGPEVREHIPIRMRVELLVVAAKTSPVLPEHW